MLLQSKIIVQHAEPQLPHLATRWTLMYEDADLTIPLKNAESFGYPHIHVSNITLRAAWACTEYCAMSC